MIKTNKVLDRYIKGETLVDRDRKMAAERIRSLLSAIDFDAEKIPENNRNMMIRLITSLKGEELNRVEKTIICEITEAKFNKDAENNHPDK